MPDTITILLGMLGIAVTLGAIILTALHRMESRINRRMDAIEANAQKDTADSEARLRAESTASEARANTKFEEINEQMRIGQARTDKGFADMHEELRITNTRMASIEQRQARLEGLLDGLREALFQRVQQ